LSSLPKITFKPSPASSSSRTIATSTSTTRANGADQVDWTKVASSVGIAAVAVVGLNLALNRETRDALSVAESSYLNETFRWTGGGLLITAITAKLLHGNGTALRIMQLNPWVAMGVGLVASIGSMMGVYYTEPDSPAHYACWALFSATQGVTLSPMFFLNPAILSRAGLYTVGALGGLCYVGATAESEKFLYIGGPLLAGLGVLLVTSLAPMIMPRMAMRTMTVLENVSAYGGVALFSAFILYDTQKILKHAKMAEMGIMKRDPIRESVSLILDAINLFVRIVQVLMLQQRRK
ncbi:growth hormone-inducible transmembrane protein, partial [Phenoliferia sp. Uapishka_3]